MKDENENDDTEDELQMDGVDFYDNLVYGLGSSQGRRQSFFQRSESTLCLGCPPPDPFNTPMSESLPLADQPHLLQPNARREDLFGIPKQPITIPSSGNEPPGVNSPLELPPTMLGLSPHKIVNQIGSNAIPTTTDEIINAQKQTAQLPVVNTDYDNQTSSNSKFMETNISSGGAEGVSGDMATVATMPTIFETEQQQQQQQLINKMHIVVKADVHSEPSRDGNDMTALPCSSKDIVGPIEGGSNTNSGGGNGSSPNSGSATKRKASDQYPAPASETFGNIFMQLKKKNYYDQYDEDNRGYEKRDGK